MRGCGGLIVDTITTRVRLTRLGQPHWFRERLAADVRNGLSVTPKSIPPVYFYDARGSDLFEQITELDEYYLTRAEHKILRDNAADIMARCDAEEIVELGSGSARKVTPLLAHMRQHSRPRYACLDVSQTAVAHAAKDLHRDFPWLRIDGYVGNFDHDLCAIARDGRRLIVFLGSTIGTYDRPGRRQLLEKIAAAMEPGDAFLVGVDLVKDVDVMVRAYDDASGITAEFNRNVLSVINRELDGDIPLDAFTHMATWVQTLGCIEMHLVATRAVVARLAAADIVVSVARREHIITERSWKLDTGVFSAELADAGLMPSHSYLDVDSAYAVILAELV